VEKPLAMVVNELCQQRGWRVKFNDLDPSTHRSNMMMMAPGPAQQAHPFYKTRRCIQHERNFLSTGCPRGSDCPFAHSEEELREPPTDLEPEAYLYELELWFDDNQSVRFVNVISKERKGEAKADVARQCLEYIEQFCQDDRQIETRQLSNKEAKQLIWHCKQLAGHPTLDAASRHSFDRWLSCLGGMVGAPNPDLARRVREAFGSFRAFVMAHEKQFRHILPRNANPDVFRASDEPSPECQQVVSRPYAGPITLSSDDDVLEFLTTNSKDGSGSEIVAALESGDMIAHNDPSTSRFLATVLMCVRETSQSGIGVKDLKEKLQTVMNLGRTIKTFRLCKYLASMPSLFVLADLGTNDGAQKVICQHIDVTSNDDFPPLVAASDMHGGTQYGEHIRKMSTAAAEELRLDRIIESTVRSIGQNKVHNEPLPVAPLKQLASALPIEAYGLGAYARQLQGIDVDLLGFMTIEDLVKLKIPQEAATRLMQLVASQAIDVNHTACDGTNDLDILQQDQQLNLAAHVDALTAEVTALRGQVAAMRAKEDAYLCQICMECPMDTLILPCMHTMYCGACLVDIGPCPTCRTPIRGKLQCLMSA
jgi:hypothetical protein